MSSKINAISTGVGGLATSADASGILEIQTNDTTAITVDGSQVVSFDNNFGTVAGLPSFQCRAWVNFNGTGTVAIRGSGNVTSITDNGTGNYTVNFATAMPDANYSIAGSALGDIPQLIMSPYITVSTTQCRVIISNTTQVADNAMVSVSVFSN